MVWDEQKALFPVTSLARCGPVSLGEGWAVVMTSDHPHVQAQAPTRSGGQQRGAVVCTLDEGDGGLGGCCERRAGLAQGSRAENSWLGTCPREAGFGARQMHR